MPKVGWRISGLVLLSESMGQYVMIATLTPASSNAATQKYPHVCPHLAVMQ
jgi:hypothetical protein